MKTIVYVLLCLLLSFVAIGQENSERIDEEISTPTFTGVENVVELLNNEENKSIEKYLCSELRKSDLVFETNEAGTAVIKFTVDERGKLSNIEVVNSVCCVLDEELVDILETTDGMWKPAIRDGNHVAMEKEISLAFVCSEVANCQEFMMSKARKNFDKANQQMMVKNNPKKALRYYNESIKYCPYETSSLLLRGLCKYEVGDKEGAYTDWKRVNELGEIDASEYINNLITREPITNNSISSESLAEMKKILNQ